MVLALREYFGLCRAMGYQVIPWMGYVASFLLCLALDNRPRLPLDLNTQGITALLLLFLLLITTWALRQNMDLKDYLVATSLTVFGILYIGLSLACLAPIRFSPNALGTQRYNGRIALEFGPQPILLLFLVIWAGDICAYLIGRPFGRIPFFARISPRKTWEGALAGLAGSLLAAWGFAYWFWKTADLKTVMLLAAWIAVAGQVGDLVESAIKRGAKQKDSGALLPGHGGFLDRIDSLLFGAPALWLALLTLLAIWYAPFPRRGGL
jgi:phosphatidate cytidylyltransferase